MLGKLITTTMVFVAVMGVFSQPATANFIISCQGTESNGGGQLNYEYVLQSQIQQTLTILEIATDDLNPANYTNITMPPGFAFSLLQTNKAWTSDVKTAHGQVMPGGVWVRQTAGVIQFTNPAGLVMGPGQVTAVFGFNHPWHSKDAEWGTGQLVGGVPVSTVANPALPVAGPLGTFTGGPVHGPIPEPSAFALMTLGGLAVMRRKRN
ncbi:MAG: PEP-CTERM sorting domain-containing protein [Planctomycetota bacterium]|jgi:hypothetical protein